MPEPGGGPRDHPFDAFLTGVAGTRFPVIRAALAAGDVDPLDRDAFVMVRPVVELVHALRPEGGVGEAMPELVALAHLAYLYWAKDQVTVRLGEADLQALSGVPAGVPSDAATPAAYYAQFPPRRIWGSPVEHRPPEPLDGFFVAGRADRLMVAAVFGFHPARAALTLVHAEGPAPSLTARSDGTALFESVLPGGREAGLRSVLGGNELLELAWRVHRTAVIPSAREG